MKFILIISLLIHSTTSYGISCWAVINNAREVKTRLITREFKEIKNFDYKKFSSYREMLKSGKQIEFKTTEAQLAFLEHVSFLKSEEGLGFGSLDNLSEMRFNQKAALIRATQVFNKKGKVLEKRLDDALEKFYVVLHAPDYDFQKLANVTKKEKLKEIFIKRLKEESLKDGIFKAASEQGILVRQSRFSKALRERLSSPKLSFAFNTVMNYYAFSLKGWMVGFMAPLDFLRISEQAKAYGIKYGPEAAAEKFFKSRTMVYTGVQETFDVGAKYWNRYAIAALIGTTIYNVYDDIHISDDEVAEGKEVIDEIEEAVVEDVEQLEELIDKLNPGYIVFTRRMERKGIELNSEKYFEEWKKYFGKDFPYMGDE